MVTTRTDVRRGTPFNTENAMTRAKWTDREFVECWVRCESLEQAAMRLSQLAGKPVTVEKALRKADRYRAAGVMLPDLPYVSDNEVASVNAMIAGLGRPMGGGSIFQTSH